jgi:hypothetical protein
MKPAYQVLRQFYPRTDSREALFADIGWDDLVKDRHTGTHAQSG